MRSLEERFWEKVELEPMSGCMMWTGSTAGRGSYGRVRSGGGGRVVQATRAAWEMTHGVSVPEGAEVDHLCRVPICVNPAHLEVVTPSVNALRGAGPGGHNALKTHCPSGHEYTPENTYSEPSRPNRRLCRECKAERNRAYRASRRGN